MTKHCSNKSDVRDAGALEAVSGGDCFFIGSATPRYYTAVGDLPKASWVPGNSCVSGKTSMSPPNVWQGAEPNDQGGYTEPLPLCDMGYHWTAGVSAP